MRASEKEYEPAEQGIRRLKKPVSEPYPESGRLAGIPEDLPGFRND
ncbi:hypothetical protein [uncultured Merdimonas sp.]